MKHSYDPQRNLWSRPDFSGIAYSDGSEVEDRLLQVMQSVNDKSVFSTELASHICDWPSEYHLTASRHCLMRPIPFKAGESVLELGCGCGAITRHLGELDLNVTAVEGGAKRVEITAERVRDLPNVKVVFDDLVQFQTEEKFDWVTLIGVLEYSPMFAPGDDPVRTYLQQALSYLKPGGRLIIAIENQLGLKYFNGCGEDHVSLTFFGPQGLYTPGGPVTFGKKQLRQRLLDSGFSAVDFFYPYPDYKLPQAIVTETAFETPGFQVSEMLLRIEPRDYNNRRSRLFSEQLVAHELENNGVLSDFFNSFLLVAHQAVAQEAPPADTIAWCFSLNRLPHYKTETSFHIIGEEIEVRKTRAIPASSTPSTAPETLKHHLGKSLYSKGHLQAWQQLKAKLRPFREKDLVAAFVPYAQYLLSQSELIAGHDPALLESWLTPGNHVDLTPFNIIETISGPQAIDQEWEISKKIPMGWIFLRAMVNTLAIGITPEDVGKTTLDSLMQAILASLEMQYAPSSFQQWAQLEQEFIEIVTGKKPGLLTPDVSIAQLSPYYQLNLDRRESQRFNKPVEEATKPLSLSETYRKWQKKRTIVAEEIQAIYAQIENYEQTGNSEPVSFHIIIRLAKNGSALLADTLDSLNGQIYPHWHLDILTTLPAPEGLQDVPCLGWHENACPEEDKALIDTLISEKMHDWCLEIPAGAKLDPLYFWRLSVEIDKQKDSKAIFVDDDCFNHNNETTDPRFKPGVNPAALISSDLAGPICVPRASWIAIGGASPNSGSPWFLQLLRIARHYGWNAIRHIPDVLISYPSVFPTDLTSCTIALLEHLDYENTKSEIIPTTGQSWCIRYALPAIPKVTIAIISAGRLDMLQRCLNSIVNNTNYPPSQLELFIVLNRYTDDPELEHWLATLSKRGSWEVSTILTPSEGNKSTRCNAALHSASSEFTLLLDEEVTISTSSWLSDLVATCAQPSIGGTSPCLIRPEANTIHQAGLVLGMTGLTSIPTKTQAAVPVQSNLGTAGIVAQLYEKSAMHDSTGYLNLIKAPRDVSALSSICMLVRTKACLEVGGMDEEVLGDNLADVDLSLKLRQKGWRLIYQPLASVGFGDITDIRWTTEPKQLAEQMLDQANARQAFQERWWPEAAVDSFWNKNLSIFSPIPEPETSIFARWQYLPMSKPRLLARTLNNGQGKIRLSQPFEALRKTGRAQAFDYPQTHNNRPISPSELLRLAPDVVIMQHYLNNQCLPELEAWHATPGKPFLVYAMDDLLTELDETNPFKKNISQDARSRLKQALKLSDRLVVSTDYLAESYRNLISDIRVVPNFLEQGVWLPLRSQRRTGPKPRVGWAGGTTHQGDLILLKEIIEQTRNEADWIFFGMCPDDIRPLLSEYHPLIPIEDYPAHLASLNLDIAVAPLAPTPFNRGKSNLRLLEYGILGLPVVCTAIDPYQNSPACCVSNTPDAWVKALRERIFDADARELEGQAMREWVLNNFLLENNLDAWLDAHLPD